LGDEPVRESRLLGALVTLWYVAALAAAVTALAHILTYVQVAVTRIPFPFTLEWMEGGSLVQVSRILSGELLYVRPSMDFIPQVYPPLFFYVAALASEFLGTSFAALRLVSFLSSLAILILIGLIVQRASRSA
jgi:hypothetical protein